MHVQPQRLNCTWFPREVIPFLFSVSLLLLSPWNISISQLQRVQSSSSLIVHETTITSLRRSTTTVRHSSPHTTYTHTHWILLETKVYSRQPECSVVELAACACYACCFTVKQPFVPASGRIGCQRTLHIRFLACPSASLESRPTSSFGEGINGASNPWKQKNSSRIGHG